jgi:protein LTV1
MGRGKRVKPFIDKKTAATFHLVRRSQRDVQGWNEANSDDENGVSNTNNEFVLMPSPCNPPKYSQVIILDPKPSQVITNVSKEDEEGMMVLSSRYLNHVRERLSSNAPHALRDVEAEVYDKFTKPITGEGTFISAKGTAANQYHQVLSSTENLLMQELASVLPGQEVERTLESITINPDCMDPEVAAALFGDWDVVNDGEEADGKNTFEEILDDFVFTASQEPAAITEEAEDDVLFNYDIHIQQLMERAKCNYNAGNQKEHQWARDDAMFFQHYRKLDEDYNEEEEDEEEVDSWDDNIQVSSVVPGVVPALSAEEERALRNKFEATLAEYDTNSDDTEEEDEYVHHHHHHPHNHADSVPIHNVPSTLHNERYSSYIKNEMMDDQDSIGEICTIRTNITTEMQQQHALLEIADQQLDSILNSYLQDREERRLAEGATQSFKIKNKISTGGSGYFALQQHVNVGGVEDEEKEEYYTLVDKELAPAPEEILIDGKSYFSEKKVSTWDCESILSTYSNLDNNPLVIQRRTLGRKKKGNKEKKTNAEMIQLSNKTGLPIVNTCTYGDDDNDNGSNTAGQSINKGMARKRDETAQEKQARKLAAKKEKHVARAQKKRIQLVFKEESRKLDAASGTNELVGQSVFRY